uniref:SAM domain-containing protein n=1 Tax=Magallana gigas TaxID=29159 RepID=A0A8W8JBN9_MAGGI
MAATSSVTLDLGGVLADLDLNDTIENFKSERIDLDNFLSLTEQQLIRLGVKTIGDRLRLTERKSPRSEETHGQCI